MLTIDGKLDLLSKRLTFDKPIPLIVGENRTTLLHIEMPAELADYDIYLTIADSKGGANISPKLGIEIVEEKHYISYLLLNDALKASGRLLLQLEAHKEEGGKVKTYKSIVNQQLCVNSTLSADKQLEELPNLVAETQMAIDHANMVANQLLEDKQSGVFDGKDGAEGKKGDPSTLDKIGINATIIDLSDKEIGTYGTIDNPIEITENSTISFAGYTPVTGYLKSFMLYIKRVGNYAVTWQHITAWAYDEIPILPVGQVQKVLVETEDGINYYGTGGDCFDV